MELVPSCLGCNAYEYTQAHPDLMCLRLQELILPGNEFRTFPPEIFRLKKITRLSLARNGIKAVPPEIGALTTLTEIDLSHNSISELPQPVRNFYFRCFLLCNTSLYFFFFFFFTASY